MKKTTLIFPDINTLSDFVQDYMIAGVEVNSLQLSLTGALTEHQMEDACNNYRATPGPSMPFSKNSTAPGNQRSGTPLAFLADVPIRAN